MEVDHISGNRNRSEHLSGVFTYCLKESGFKEGLSNRDVTVLRRCMLRWSLGYKMFMRDPHTKGRGDGARMGRRKSQSEMQADGASIS